MLKPRFQILRILRFSVLAIVLHGGSLAAQSPDEIPDSEALNPPTSERIDRLVDAYAPTDWAPGLEMIHSAAVRAYHADRLGAAEGWFYVYRWASLFSQTEGDFVHPWAQAMEQAKIGSGRTITFEARRSLASALSPATEGWFMKNPAFSEEFFSLVSRLDYMPRVLQILGNLFAKDPDRFAHYSSLAIAIAVVYDMPPPPWWPHAQVSQDTLKRQWPLPSDAFDWWIKEDLSGRTYHRLGSLRAEELKFVVDASEPFDQLTWSQQIVNYPLAQFAKTYFMIRYSRAREENDQMVWTQKPYTLPNILAAGGICMDQAYFACEAGKARGIPTLLFSGEGRDGRHAWFGYLDGDKVWQLDAGRYAEQRFVTGRAIDPQTWQVISDHELQFLEERFRALPNFRQSRIHEQFAGDFLEKGDTAEAVTAARAAVDYEPRNLPAWTTLMEASGKLGVTPVQREALLRQAALAFRRYPDLQVVFVNAVCESLRKRGETSAADFEERGFAKSLQADRSDLSVEKARDMLLRSMGSEPLDAQIRTYNSLVDTYGPGAGIAFFDQIVRIFVEHLAQAGDSADAVRAAARARSALAITEGTQMDREMQALVDRINLK